MATASIAFTPLPVDERQTPQRKYGMTCRFKLSFPEHQEALDYYERRSEFMGDKSALIVHAVCQLQADLASGCARPYTMTIDPRELDEAAVVQRSWLVYWDKWVESRCCYDFYSRGKAHPGWATNMFVAALLNLRDREQQLLAA
jgi:hypothetical protein